MQAPEDSGPTMKVRSGSRLVLAGLVSVLLYGGLLWALFARPDQVYSEDHEPYGVWISIHAIWFCLRTAAAALLTWGIGRSADWLRRPVAIVIVFALCVAVFAAMPSLLHGKPAGFAIVNGLYEGVLSLPASWVFCLLAGVAGTTGRRAIALVLSPGLMCLAAWFSAPPDNIDPLYDTRFDRYVLLPYMFCAVLAAITWAVLKIGRLKASCRTVIPVFSAPTLVILAVVFRTNMDRLLIFFLVVVPLVVVVAYCALGALPLAVRKGAQ